MLKTLVVAFLVVFATEPGLAHSADSWGEEGSAQLDEAISKIGQDYLDVSSGVGLSIGVFENGRSHFYHLGSTEKTRISSQPMRPSTKSVR
jgi:hypothetical protein